MNRSLQEYFKQLADSLYSKLKNGEHLFLNLSGDDTQFIRVNAAKVRQCGIVENYFLDFIFLIGEKEGQLKKATAQITLTMNEEIDLESMLDWINQFRLELPNYPFDPYAVLPAKNAKETTQEVSGKLLPRDQAAKKLLDDWKGQDLAGFYSGGLVVRGMSNSAGLFHWFKCESYSFDFSLYTSAQKAMKAGVSGAEWNESAYAQTVQASIQKLEALKKPSIRIKPGDYRVYLAPAALCDVIEQLSWSFGELAIRQDKSPIRFLKSNQKQLSERFTLTDDFSEGLVPRFNEEGDLAPEKMTLIQNGSLQSTLVNTRSAKEFSMTANGANGNESMRSPVVARGSLSENQILSSMGTGIYISNLHYLNWSDEVNGRITGMTRYACFWVEDGKIQCPIENMRFDETIFDLLGSSVIDFTDFDEYCPVTSTYDYRQIGGVRTPGVLLSKMSFTL